METNDMKGTSSPSGEDLVIDIPKDLEDELRPEICICRVPKAIRKTNEGAYTPQVISIGPIHNGKPEFKDMEKIKLVYLKKFYARMHSYNKQEEVEKDVPSFVKDHAAKIRHCYAEIPISCTDQFVKMITLDAAFIIELFLKVCEPSNSESKYENDFIVGQPSLRKAVKVDLKLLENQLPYFILEELYEFVKKKFLPGTRPDFASLVSSYFELPYSDNPSKNLPFFKNLKNFADLERNYLLINESKFQQDCSKRARLRYNATKLHAAGVKLVAVKEGVVSLLDIEFENGELKIPFFQIDDCFERKVRNVMALEQSRYPDQTYVCNYLSLLDHLVNTAEDVELLIEKGILANWLGDDSMVAEFINKLCQGIEEHNCCYSVICEKLNKHYENPWNHRKAMLKLVYFSNLWRGTGTVAAAMLLVFTFIQTVIAIRSAF